MGRARLGGPGETPAQKLTEVLGGSKESFAEAIGESVETPSKKVRNLKWFRTTGFEGRIGGHQVVEFPATVRIHFDSGTP